MYAIKRKYKRNIEIITGFIVLITSFSYIASILLDFTFVTPYSTLDEDLMFLSDQFESQRISSVAWIITSVMTGLAIPFYLITMHKRVKYMHFISAVFLVVSTTCFFFTGWLGLKFSTSVNHYLTQNLSNIDDSVILRLLNDFREEQLFKRIASSSIGAFTILLAITRIRLRTIPVVSSFLFLIAGPLLIFFNWYDIDHLVRTASMAAIAIGMLIFCVRLINKGLVPIIR